MGTDRTIVPIFQAPGRDGLLADARRLLEESGFVIYRMPGVLTRTFHRTLLTGSNGVFVHKAMRSADTLYVQGNVNVAPAVSALELAGYLTDFQYDGPTACIPGSEGHYWDFIPGPKCRL